MSNRIESLEIATTTDGAIDLIQADPIDPDRTAVVRITTDQVDIVIERLKEAKAELLGSGGGSHHHQMPGL